MEISDGRPLGLGEDWGAGLGASEGGGWGGGPCRFRIASSRVPAPIAGGGNGPPARPPAGGPVNVEKGWSDYTVVTLLVRKYLISTVIFIDYD